MKASTPAIKVPLTFTPVEWVNDPAGGVLGSTELRAKLDLRNSTVELIKPQWPRMTRRDKTAVAKFMDGLRAHERTHLKYVRNFLPRLNGLPLTAEGDDRAQAEREISAEKARVLASARMQLKQLTRTYKIATDHGRKQSKAGGRNVVITCRD